MKLKLLSQKQGLSDIQGKSYTHLEDYLSFLEIACFYCHLWLAILLALPALTILLSTEASLLLAGSC